MAAGGRPGQHDAGPGACAPTPSGCTQRARRQFSDEEIAEAFAATRGLTMPSQLRRMLRQQGRDLHAEFLELLPYRLPPVRIQRWSWRRVALTIGDAVRRAARRR